MKKFRTYGILALMEKQGSPYITLTELYHLLATTFPWMEVNRKNLYRLIDHLERDKLVETRLLATSPPIKQLKITPKGRAFVKTIAPTVRNLSDVSPSPASIPVASSLPSELSLTQEEQADIIQSIAWMLPEITGKELEDISLEESQKLEKFARRVLQKICTDIGITL